LIFAEVTELSFICFVPTEFAGSLIAAYEVPPRATKSARYAITFWRAWDKNERITKTAFPGF
jgi:hypothetical protein